MTVRDPNLDEEIITYDKLQTDELNGLDYKLNRKTPIDEYGWITEILGDGWIRITSRVSKLEGIETSVATYPYGFELTPHVLVTPLYVSGIDVTYVLEVQNHQTKVFFNNTGAQVYNIQVFGKSSIE